MQREFVWSNRATAALMSRKSAPVHRPTGEQASFDVFHMCKK
jgi:hypothetical protein